MALSERESLGTSQMGPVCTEEIATPFVPPEECQPPSCTPWMNGMDAYSVIISALFFFSVLNNSVSSGSPK